MVVRARIQHLQIYLERLQDCFFKDHIWAAKEVWREKIKHTDLL